MSEDNEITRAEFARLLGCQPSYVTKLAQADRLVFTPGGKRVRVAESLARIEATKDPNRDDVAERHAQARSAEPLPPKPQDAVGNTYQQARAVKERYAALTARAEYERMMGNLVDAEQVRMASANAGAIIRGALENLPAQLAPELAAEQDEARVQALLVEHIERLLMQISDRVAESVA